MIPGFSKKEKEEAFDRIILQYYKQNFGTMSKSDMELLLFDIYMNYLKKHESYSDYTISKQLGITQGRVRALREKRELKYADHEGESGWWKDYFLDRLSSIKYYNDKKIIKMSIPDVEIMIELRHFAEGLGLFDDYQLNPKVFSARLDIFIEICNAIDGYHISSITESTKVLNKNVIKRLEKELEKSDLVILNEALNHPFKECLKRMVTKGSNSMIKMIVPHLSFGSTLNKALEFLNEQIS